MEANMRKRLKKFWLALTVKVARLWNVYIMRSSLTEKGEYMVKYLQKIIQADDKGKEYLPVSMMEMELEKAFNPTNEMGKTRVVRACWWYLELAKYRK